MQAVLGDVDANLALALAAVESAVCDGAEKQVTHRLGGCTGGLLINEPGSEGGKRPPTCGRGRSREAGALGPVDALVVLGEGSGDNRVSADCSRCQPSERTCPRG